MTTPAKELAAAAELLRTRAQAAADDTGSPDWTAHHINQRDARLRANGHNILRGGSTGAHGRGAHPHLHPPVADYIAAMHPGVGLALADWLDSAAVDAEEIGADPHALAVARAINGGEQR